MPDRDSEVETLTTAFWSVARRLRHDSQRSLAPFDLSPSQSRALGSLLRHGPKRLGELAEHLGIAARSATEVVDGLEARGLVSRSADPDDRRATIVSVTTAGRDLLHRIRRTRMKESGEIFAQLSATDRVELARILALLRGETGPDHET